MAAVQFLVPRTAVPLRVWLSKPPKSASCSSSCWSEPCFASMTKASRFVEVDEAGARRAIGIGEPDRVLEAVAITRRIARRRLRRIDAQDMGQARGERLEVGALRGAGGGPALDEGFDRIVRSRFGCALFHIASVVLIARAGSGLLLRQSSTRSGHVYHPCRSITP
jgi:hypothetical protein